MGVKKTTGRIITMIWAAAVVEITRTIWMPHPEQRMSMTIEKTMTRPTSAIAMVR